MIHVSFVSEPSSFFLWTQCLNYSHNAFLNRNDLKDLQVLRARLAPSRLFSRQNFIAKKISPISGRSKNMKVDANKAFITGLTPMLLFGKAAIHREDFQAYKPEP